MPTYIMLVKWTQAEFERVKDSPQRIERARNAVKSVAEEQRALLYLWEVRHRFHYRGAQ